MVMLGVFPTTHLSVALRIPVFLAWLGPPFSVKTVSGLRPVLASSARVFGLTQPTHTSVPRYQQAGRDARLLKND